MPDDHSPRQPPELDLTQPRAVGDIIATALRLFRGEGLAFIALTAVVVLPYLLLVLLFAGSAVKGSKDDIGPALLIDLINVAVIVPLVSALQLQAVVAIAEGERPQVRRVFAQTLPVLPKVAAAVIVAGLGIAFGLVLLIIPGVILALRWAVVAQTATFEGTNWPTSLRRAAQLTRRNYLRILGLLLSVAVIYLCVEVVVGVIASAGAGAGDAAGIIAGLVMSSFGALCSAILYFDLRVREESPGAQAVPSL